MPGPGGKIIGCFCSLFYIATNEGRGQSAPLALFRRLWMVSHIFIPSYDGRFSHNASHSQTLLLCHTEGAGPGGGMSIIPLIYLQEYKQKILLLRGSSHIRSVLIGVKYRNCRQTLNVYLLVAISIGQNQSQQTNLQTCNLHTIQSISYKSI